MIDPLETDSMRYTLKVTSLTLKPIIELWEDFAGDDDIFHESFLEGSQMNTYRKLMISLIQRSLKITTTWNLHWLGTMMDLNFQESTRD